MSPAKLLALAAIGALSVLPAGAIAQSAQSDKTDQGSLIPIELSEFKFAPAEITLTHGQHYVLRLTNSGKRGHDLTAKDFFKTVTLDPDSTSAVKDGSVDLTPGVTADVGFTPNQTGTYEMHCSHPFHSALGMKGHITVR